MNLISFMQTISHTRTHIKGNPYQGKVYKNEMKNRVIAKFLDFTMPIFNGKDNLPVIDEVPIWKEPERIKSYEWELNQSWISLLINDLFTIIITTSNYFLQRYFSQAVFIMEIYFNIDDLDHESKGTHAGNDKIVGSLENDSGKNHSIYIAKARSYWQETFYLNNLLIKPLGKYSIRLRSSLERFSPILKQYSCFPENEAIYKRYLIRGPAYIKNLLLFIMNKRN